MSGTFVIRNQLGHYWGKSGVWVSGSRAEQVSCWAHRDEAVNTLFELGSKDTELRGEVYETETDGALAKNLEVSEYPVPKLGGIVEPTNTLESHGHTPT